MFEKYDDYITPKIRLKDILARDEVFNKFSQQTQEKMLENVSFKRFFPEQLVLGHQHVVNDIYILINGSLQVGWLKNDGKLKVNNYIVNYTVFNLVAFLQNKPTSYDVFSIGEVHIAILSGEIFLEKLRQEPEAMWQILKIMSHRMYNLFEQSKYIHTANLTQRIAYYLHKLFIQYGVLEDNNIYSISLRITQQDFSELFGITRQTLHKNLKPFLDNKIIEWNYSQIYILDLSKLEEFLKLE
ncbi:hypothetical protein B9T31_13635 [Acinetobacter sp. ANC 4558]|uniref:Crp/Fnr family transcriptional regulator n=1 Tax=Acinetobacter sp. ANC 4558 TaxID=1977876 RepID=UPI000A34877C|nr:Crp/Fnr family transcriptional regulator [Acinetobacter sp. ANC 4558]OTG84193.1 hypothetical protein B9T31_13635 [Acinetobacter sp. ANC 4558]